MRILIFFFCNLLFSCRTIPQSKTLESMENVQPLSQEIIEKYRETASNIMFLFNGNFKRMTPFVCSEIENFCERIEKDIELDRKNSLINFSHSRQDINFRLSSTHIGYTALHEEFIETLLSTVELKEKIVGLVREEKNENEKLAAVHIFNALRRFESRASLDREKVDKLFSFLESMQDEEKIVFLNNFDIAFIGQNLRKFSWNARKKEKPNFSSLSEINDKSLLSHLIFEDPDYAHFGTNLRILEFMIVDLLKSGNYQTILSTAKLIGYSRRVDDPNKGSYGYKDFWKRLIILYDDMSNRRLQTPDHQIKGFIGSIDDFLYKKIQNKGENEFLKEIVGLIEVLNRKLAENGLDTYDYYKTPVKTKWNKCKS